MYTKPTVEIVSWNKNGEEVCASAARISTTEGTAIELFDAARDNGKNVNLIEKVLKSGHKSVIEHMVFSIAMQNVSVYVEQYLIEMRLASFTVKSRRYVDFGHSGYYVPKDLSEEDQQLYRQHMDRLFDGYRKLLELDVPKEDARFVLPYSFYSNFYCTINARELLGLIRSIRCGRGRVSPELLDIANQLAEQVVRFFPAIAQEIPEAPQTVPDYTMPYKQAQTKAEWIKQSDIGQVRLVSVPQDPISHLEWAYTIGHPEALSVYYEGFRDEMIEKIMSSERPRELEQLNYGFVIHDITLAGLTHLTRHRIQSLIVPPIESVNLGRFIIPETIASNPAALSVYKETLEAAYASAQTLCQLESMRPYRGYLAVAGNVMNVMTTMNARELKTFMQLRTCNRAQWEIRQIAIRMLGWLRQSFPILFNQFGPSCFLTGECPEGRMCCGKTKEVQERFASSLQ